MRTNIIKMLLVSLSLSLVIGGCSNTKTEDIQGDNKPITQEETTNDTKEEVTNDIKEESEPTNSALSILNTNLIKDELGLPRRSNDTMYKFYASKLDDVKAIFKKYGMEYTEYLNDATTGYPDTTVLEYTTTDIDAPYTNIIYDIKSDSAGYIDRIRLTVIKHINKEEPMDFKFEDTIMNDLHELINPGTDVATIFNRETNDYYNSNPTEPVAHEIKLDIPEEIFLSEDSIQYFIKITSYLY